jgi:hypothetical protein
VESTCVEVDEFNLAIHCERGRQGL